MKNSEIIWLKDAVEKALYLNGLGVSIMKIREEIMSSQTEQFWGNQRRLLVELLLLELDWRQFNCFDDEIPF
jgi:hypothetical protein